MAKCFWDYDGVQCEAVATTQLKKNNGEIKQMCEKHYEILVKTFRAVADGDLKTHRDNGESEANHWFVLNKIPK